MIADKLKQLRSEDRESRIRCAEELGDLLEYGATPASEITAVAAGLIDAIASEADSEARESLTNTLAILASNHIGLKAPWDRLTAVLGSLDTGSLENALCALGFSWDRNFEELLEQYQKHPVESIRDAAAHALVELRAQGAT